jgi:Cupin superfamily protein
VNHAVDFLEFFRAPATAPPPRPSATVTGRELADILAPLDVARFVGDYFMRRPLHLRGAPDKFAALFDLERLREALRRADSARPARYDLRATFSGGQGTSQPLWSAQLGHVGPVLAAGGTICVTNLHLAEPGLEAVARAVKEQLSFAGTVGFNAYLSASGSGFSTHYDSRVACTLQIAGHKTWRYSREPGLAFPLRNATFLRGAVQHKVDAAWQADEEPWERLEPPDESSFEEVTLGPGDLLCLPAGNWHAARAANGDGAAGHSLALNLHLEHIPFLNTIIHLLRAELLASPSWRAGAPAVDARGAELPESVERYFDTRLAELRSVVAGLSARDPRLHRAWIHDIATQYESASAGPLPPAPCGPIEPTSLLRVRRDPPLLCYRTPAEDGREQAHLACETTTLSASVEALPFFTRLCDVDQFLAGSAVEWREGRRYEWKQVKPLLETLAQHGIVAPAADP